ncbi:hypothetical protein ACEWY4_004469 [Coilia grayii]|uniref:Uncharacterized protein n=1 Tax=Coilia grayii TaxID=363190 RepID=A0ABD1KLK8_9TELE
MYFFRISLGHTSLSTLAFLTWAAVVVHCSCPKRCSCPSPAPSCPPGISSVLDGCGCCRVCARQFNQDCSATEPCDHIKGLHCHLGVGGDPERGLCRAEAQGRPCELNGRVYQHGEDFQPSCEHQCSCMDGVVGCMPLCPHTVPLPGWHCSRPRLARLPGRCCEEWLCDDDNRIGEEVVEEAGGARKPEQLLPALPQHPDPASNELLVAPTPWDFTAGASEQEWMSSTQSHALLPSKCFLQTTDWSPCSATCGMGVSSRVTNDNAECRLARETRLCQIRQCGSDVMPLTKKGKKCQRSTRPRKPVKINFAGCSTVRRYRPRSCGSCSDGRCCEPSQTRTVRLLFHCTDGRKDFVRNVMWIQRCSCSQSCEHRGLASFPESLSLPNDIHTFTH